MGLLTLRGPREPWGGLESLLPCLLSLSFWSCLLTLSDASPDRFSKEVCNILLFPALQPMACGERRAICLVPALWCLKHRNITWGLNRGRQNPKMAKLFQSYSSASNNVQGCLWILLLSPNVPAMNLMTFEGLPSFPTNPYTEMSLGLGN